MNFQLIRLTQEELAKLRAAQTQPHIVIVQKETSKWLVISKKFGPKDDIEFSRVSGKELAIPLFSFSLLKHDKNRDATLLVLGMKIAGSLLAQETDKPELVRIFTVDPDEAAPDNLIVGIAVKVG